MSVGFDANLLLGYYQSKAGLTGSTALSTGLGVASRKVAPTAPWSGSATGPTAQEMSASIAAALGGRRFVDESAAKLDLPGASDDYRKLFALYQGLTTLDDLAQRSQAKGLTAIDRQRLQETFDRGMTEVSGYIADGGFDQFRMIQGATALSAKTTAPVPGTQTKYVTPPLVSGSSAAEVAAFQGDVKFNIQVKRISSTYNVAIDLSAMGAQPRTMGNVVQYINSQLEAAGVDMRVASSRIPGQPKTTTVSGKTVTIGQTPDQWALAVKVSTGETVSFSAPATAGAVYVAQSVGSADPDHNTATKDSSLQQQLLKFQTDTTSVPAPPNPPGSANWVDGRVFANAMGPEVAAVHDTKVGPDGSVYVLADITDKTAGQDIQGAQDVALLKYDSAGHLVYTRTLGAAGEATGLGLAVSADGKVAVAGSIKGSLTGAVDGPVNSGTTGAYAGQSDSFVTLYDKNGSEVWTARRGARQQDEASQVAFGADGTVYVSGRAQSTMPGATAAGGWDSYVEAFSTDAKGAPHAVFTQQFGTAGSDKPAGMVVDGTSLVVATIEGGHGILRRFDVSSGTPTLTSSYDMGDLQGGTIAGLALDGGQIVVAGSTTNGALNGTVIPGGSGGIDVFAERISADLSGGATVAYYGGAGDDKATSLAVSGGKVWIGGSTNGDLPGKPKLGTTDGFLLNLDVATGATGYVQRFTGRDGQAAPVSIAVDPAGASVLDRIGLPTGQLQVNDPSKRLIDATALRPGDTFTVKSDLGLRQTVTIEAADTLDTLAQKIRRASGFQAKVSITLAEDGTRHLSITPNTQRATLEFGPGKADKDALELLGIPAGLVRNTVVDKDGKSVPADGKGMIYGLGLDPHLKLDTLEDYNHARAEIATAQGIIRQAYKDLVAAATPDSVKRAQAAAAQTAGGTVPAYLSAQISNYQAALSRLTGGDNSGSSGVASLLG